MVVGMSIANFISQEEIIKELNEEIKRLRMEVRNKDITIHKKNLKMAEYRSRRIMQAQALIDNTEMSNREIADYIYTDISVVQKLRRGER